MKIDDDKQDNMYKKKKRLKTNHTIMMMRDVITHPGKS